MSTSKWVGEYLVISNTSSQLKHYLMFKINVKVFSENKIMSKRRKNYSNYNSVVWQQSALKSITAVSIKCPEIKIFCKPWFTCCRFLITQNILPARDVVEDQTRTENHDGKWRRKHGGSAAGRISVSNCLALTSPSGIALPLTISTLLYFSIRGPFLRLTTWCSY